MNWEEALSLLGAKALSSKWSLERPFPEELSTIVRARVAELEAALLTRGDHHGACNYRHGPFGGPGCICVVTYRAALAQRSERREGEPCERCKFHEGFAAWDSSDPCPACAPAAPKEET